VQRFSNLKVWQRAQELAVRVYKSTQQFPDDEKFGMTSQMRRAVVSVSTNLAEGSKRAGRRDFARFINTSEGSLAELESLCLLSERLSYLPESERDSLVAEMNEIARMLNGLRVAVVRER